VFRITGKLASENAARSPRRTSSTASALMVGLALVTLALVVGTSIKTSFSDSLESTIRADWYVDSGGFLGFSPDVADQLAELDELEAVNAGRFNVMQVEGSTKAFTSLDYDTLNEMFELGIVEGEVTADSRGVMMGTDPAADLGVQPGDTITAIFNETGAVELPVVAIYEETAIVGNWVIDNETYRENFTEDLDFFLAATTAEGVEPDEARAAIGSVLAPFPNLDVQDREEFQQAQEGQLDAVLIVVNVFLLFAIIIAGIGIANTLALSVFERTRELGLLRAVGETRAQVWGMVTLEAILVAVLGAILGIAIGVGFGVAVASVVPEDFISILDIPYTSLVVVLIVAILLGAVASLYPAWRASRLNVLEAVAFE
jgi:putative ABC transport system permease protein